MTIFVRTPVVERINSPHYDGHLELFQGPGFGMVRSAYMFGAGAHGAVRQHRKYTGARYIVHPVEVLNILMCAERVDGFMAQAALLHDTVEDTGLDFQDLLTYFDRRVVDHLYYLTDRHVQLRLDGLLNRKGRKAIDLAHYEEAPGSTKTIKVADLISNSADIVQHDVGFARRYLREKEDALAVLKDGADPLLVDFAFSLLEEGKAKVGL